MLHSSATAIAHQATQLWRVFLLNGHFPTSCLSSGEISIGCLSGSGRGSSISASRRIALASRSHRIGFFLHFSRRPDLRVGPSSFRAQIFYSSRRMYRAAGYRDPRASEPAAGAADDVENERKRAAGRVRADGVERASRGSARSRSPRSSP
jgi:hypothetical protein